MGEGVIADLVAFAEDALHDGDVVLRDFPDHEEGGFDVVLLEDVEDLRGVFWVGAIVEGDGDLLGVITVLGDGVGQRIGVHGLGDDGEVLRRDGIVVVHGEGATTVLRGAGDAKNVAVTFGVYVLTGGDDG